jgi:hypothetical protein
MISGKLVHLIDSRQEEVLDRKPADVNAPARLVYWNGRLCPAGLAV